MLPLVLDKTMKFNFLFCVTETLYKFLCHFRDDILINLNCNFNHIRRYSNILNYPLNENHFYTVRSHKKLI